MINRYCCLEPLWPWLLRRTAHRTVLLSLYYIGTFKERLRLKIHKDSTSLSGRKDYTMVSEGNRQTGVGGGGAVLAAGTPTLELRQLRDD